MRPTIRLATSEDLPRIRQLVPGAQDLTTVPGRRYVLVLDEPRGGIAAAAGLTLERGRGHLGFLAINPDAEGERLEDRMIAVAEAVAEAFGCDTLDVKRAA
jgi:N-acetylglutamate synthase-like GNAT family acetyltransferase